MKNFCAMEVISYQQIFDGAGKCDITKGRLDIAAKNGGKRARRIPTWCLTLDPTTVKKRV